MRLTRGLRMLLVAVTASLLLASSSSASPIRLYERDGALAMKRDVSALGSGSGPATTPASLPATAPLTTSAAPASNATLPDSTGAVNAATTDTTPVPSASLASVALPSDSSQPVDGAASTALPLTTADTTTASNATTPATTTPIPDSAAQDTTQVAASSSQQTFPSYGDYQGNVTESTYHPFLAEVDTLFSPEQIREYGPAPYETRYRALDDPENKFDVLKHWAYLSPYYSSPLYPDIQKYKALPSQCKLKQVHMLHRHGARLPTDGTQEAAPHFGQFITNLTQSNTSFSFSGPLHFLNDWEYTLGSNMLTPAGSQQLFDSGIQSYYRYSALYNASAQQHKPIVRTTSQSRMIDSATYFNLGFFGKNAASLTNLEVLIESDNFNSTLSSGESCTNAEDFSVSEPKVQTWLEKYLQQAVDRFQHYVQGFTLTPRLVFGMQSLCAYETYALGVSDFCPLFTKEEWKGFEYANDLHYSWSYGSASPTGKAQGIGWGQEMITRMKSANFTGPTTSQNSTLDQDPTYFPTDQRFYFDFSHDSVIVSVLAALNFTQFDAELDPTQMDTKRNFVLSHLAPFAARLFFEVLECHNEGVAEHYIRALLNDALLPLSQGQGCPASALKDGLCPLDKFIKHFETNAVDAADYQHVCFDKPSSPSSSSSAPPAAST